MKKATSILLFCLAAMWSIAQSDVPQVMFYGYVEEGKFEDPNESKRKREKAPPKLTEVKVFIYAADTLYSTQDVRETGFYALLLESGTKYRVVFEKEGYFCKCFELDCRNVEYPQNDAAVKCLTDVSLFKKVDDADLLNLCKFPFAKCKFDSAANEMVWDLDYTERTKEKFYDLAQPYYMAEKK